VGASWNTFDARALSCGGVGVYTLARDENGKDFAVKINKVQSGSTVVADYIELADSVGKHTARAFQSGKVNIIFEMGSK